VRPVAEGLPTRYALGLWFLAPAAETEEMQTATEKEEKGERTSATSVMALLDEPPPATAYDVE
jgi:hypothetical protein